MNCFKYYRLVNESDVDCLLQVDNDNCYKVLRYSWWYHPGKHWVRTTNNPINLLTIDGANIDSFRVLQSSSRFRTATFEQLSEGEVFAELL